MQTDAEIQRLDTNIEANEKITQDAMAKAVTALAAIGTHEQICSLRYAAIDEKLKGLNRALYICLFIIACLVKSEKLSELLKLIGFGT